MEYKVALCDDDEKIASKIMEAFNNELHAHKPQLITIHQGMY